VTLPLAGDRAMLQRSHLAKPEEVCLRPGDLLYLPRGYAHEAFTTDDSSLHLTVGINIYRWVDLLRRALDGAARADARFRESIPPNALLDVASSAGLRDRFDELLGVLRTTASCDDAVGRLANEFLNGLPMLPQARFVAQRGVDDIGLSSVLVKAPGAICRCSVYSDSAIINFPGGQISGPARIGPVLCYIAVAERFAVRELPNNLGVAGNIVLVKRLVREGLLSIEQPMDETIGRPAANGSAQHLDEFVASR
jgi:hypothetical protein